MAHDDWLVELLRRREEYGNRGHAPSPEELCADCPELLGELKQALRKLERVEAFLDLTPDRPAQPPLPEGYESLGVLGQGGMGVVYKARQVKLNRVVALKMLRAGAGVGPEEFGRFRREADALARHQHPNVVQIFEVGEQEGRPYLVLEFVEGGSLAQALNGSPQPPREAAQLVETLARAVHYAHQQGIVHRDLKPANVLLASGGWEHPDALTRSGGSHPPLAGLVPKITDFGLAKRLGGEAGWTQTGAILGTPSYMAPEQALGRNQAVGPATDVYALGAILYELLTGRPPFRAETMLGTLEQVRSREPVPPRRLQPATPRDLETIVLKCLSKEPGRRYPSAAALADDLRRYLQDQPIQARPVSRAERCYLWCRRSPVRALLLVAVLALAFLSVDTVSQRGRVRHHAQLLKEIDETRVELQGKLDDEKHRGRQLVLGVSRIADAALDNGPRDPEIKELAEKLKGLLERFRADFGSEGLSEAEDLRIRLARATVANADRQFAEALQVITDDDARAARAATQAQMEREVRVNAVRGDALFGLRRWEQALTCYERILQLRPDSLGARLMTTDCRLMLKRWDEAREGYTTLIAAYTKLVEREGRKEYASNLAVCLAGHGFVLQVQGDFAKAVRDLDQAVELLTRLVNREGRGDLAGQLARGLCNRGFALHGQDELAEAVRDFDEAVAILDRVVNREDRAELAYQLAQTLGFRGYARQAQGKLPQAVEDLDQAVALLTRLTDKGGRGELVGDLARNLTIRGTTLHLRGDLAGAIRDLDRSVALHTRLVNQEGREELTSHLAQALAGRGAALGALGEHSRALGDLDQAITLFGRLVRPSDRLELAHDLAQSLNNRGHFLEKQGKLPEALRDLDQAVALLTKLAREEGREEFAPDLALSLLNRGGVLRAYAEHLQQSQGLLREAAERWKEAEKALWDARDLSEVLVCDHPAVRDYQATLTQSHIKLGSLYQATGRPKEAAPALQEALEGAKALARDHPAVPAYRAMVADCHILLGALHMAASRPKEAEQALQEALAIYQALARDYPTMPEYRALAARIHGNLGILFRTTDQLKKAERAYQNARDTFQALARDYPAVPEYRAQLANLHNDLGSLYAEAKRTKEAEQAYREALAIDTALVRDYPTMPEYRISLGMTCYNLGHDAQAGGKAETALEHYTRAITTVEPVLTKLPNEVTARRALRFACRGRAETLVVLGRNAEALKDWDRGLELADGGVRNAYRLNRAWTLARLEEHARATAESDALTESPNAPAAVFYVAACIYSLSAAAARADDKLADRYATRAVELLRQAFAKGFRDVDLLKKARDLEPLRQRKDFQKLLKEMEEKAQPSVR
jgi:serine/threonine protein kinase/tetratricopeptide (TPR) repeat protein